MTEVRGSQGPLVEPCTFFPVLLRQESLYIALAGPEGMSTRLAWPQICCNLLCLLLEYQECRHAPLLQAVLFFFFFTPFFVLVCTELGYLGSHISPAGRLLAWVFCTWCPGTSAGSSHGPDSAPFPACLAGGGVPHPPSLPKSCGTVCTPPPAAPWSWSRQGRPHSCSCCCQGEPIPGLPPIHCGLLNARVFSD